MNIKRAAALFLLLALAVFCPPAALAQELLPDSEVWQPYLEASPVDPEAFAKDPLAALGGLLPDEPFSAARQALRGYADVLLFIALAAVLAFLTDGSADADLLDFASAGGCGILLWGNIMELAEVVCGKTDEWKNFLLGFLPVYAGVLAAGGESAASSSVGGLLLTALCFLAQAISAWLAPFLQCYLALAIACCVCDEPALASACRLTGTLLRRALSLAGRTLALLLGVQRVFTLQLDRSAVRACRLLAGTVPIIGQTLSDAAETALAALRLLKGGLGLAALAILGAEFLPLYIGLLLHAVLLKGCGLLCAFANLQRCKALFECMAQAVQCMAASAALYFGIAAFGTVLMMAAGGG